MTSSTVSPAGSPPKSAARSGALMAMCSMLTVQLGLGAAVGLIDDLARHLRASIRITEEQTAHVIEEQR